MKVSQKNSFYSSFVRSITEDSDPREVRISRSLVVLSNKTIDLGERVSRLDKLIKDY